MGSGGGELLIEEHGGLSRQGNKKAATKSTPDVLARERRDFSGIRDKVSYHLQGRAAGSGLTPDGRDTSLRLYG